jgi:glycyl-tRNA synthetase beta subunit
MCNVVALQVLSFVERRLETLLTDSGAQPELVRAVLRQRVSNPALAAASVRELQVCIIACMAAWFAGQPCH